MTQNRNLKRRVRARAAKTGESYTAARTSLVPPGGVHEFEQSRPADYLDRIPLSRIGKSYKPAVIDALSIQPGQTVVDLGCGTGVDLGALLAAASPEGTVIGVDNDPAALETAARRVNDERLQLLNADASQLPLADESVDRVHTDRVLQHVPDPFKVLGEVRRVTRAGARAVFAEPDWDTLVIDYPEREVAAAYRRFVRDEVVRNPRIGSELPRLGGEAGFVVEGVIPVTATFTNAIEADRILGFARVTTRAVERGYLTPEDGQRWLEHLAHRPFFASLTLFAVVLTC